MKIDVTHFDFTIKIRILKAKKSDFFKKSDFSMA